MDSHQKKTRLMYASVTLIVAIIFFLWLFNINNVFQGTKKLAGDQNQLNWQEFKANFNKTIEEAGSRFSGVGEENAESVEPENNSSVFINDLIEATDKLASSTVDVIAEENTPILENNNCPEWINCMPTISDEPRACQIPSGCEGITQIAY